MGGQRFKKSPAKSLLTDFIKEDIGLEMTFPKTKYKVILKRERKKKEEKIYYYEPKTIISALKLLNKYGDKAKIIAGGTDIIPKIRDKVFPIQPKVLVSLRKIERLKKVYEDEYGLTLGPMLTLSELATINAVKERYKILLDAVQLTAVPEIRNMATLGGAILQDPWCWYYKASNNAFYCIRKGG